MRRVPPSHTRWQPFRLPAKWALLMRMQASAGSHAIGATCIVAGTIGG